MRDPNASSPLHPTEHRTKSELVFEHLREWILSGRLAPGDRLDQEWLSEELRVSRMPLRAALLRLEAEGLIKSQPYRGATVAPVSRSELEDVYASRDALETMLAEVAIGRIPSGAITDLRDNLDAQHDAVDAQDFSRFAALDRTFHDLVYRASGYVHGCQMVDRLRDISERYIRIYASTEGGAAASLLEHRMLLDALTASDPAAAVDVVRQHLERGRDVLLKMIPDSQEHDDEQR